MDKTATEWMIEPLRRYAQFSGRARRAEYWWFVLFGAIAAVAASILDLLIFGPAVVSSHVTMMGGVPVTVTQTSTRFIGTAVSLALFCPQLAVGIRRIHDLDRSGWWAALPITLIAITGLGVAAGHRLDLGGLSGLVTVIVGVCGIGAAGSVVMLFAWACTRGTDGPNRFGPDPLTTPPTD